MAVDVRDRDVEILIEKISEDVARSLDGPWDRGKLTPEAISSAIADYRARHPYRPEAIADG